MGKRGFRGGPRLGMSDLLKMRKMGVPTSMAMMRLSLRIGIPGRRDWILES